MKKILCITLAICILTGCSTVNSTNEPLDYEKQLEELKGQNIEYRCSDLGRGDSYDFVMRDCYDQSIFVNSNKRIYYSITDYTHEGRTKKELITDKGLYAFPYGEEVQLDEDFSERVENPQDEIFQSVDKILTFAAMLNAFNQEVGVVVVYEKGSPHWDEFAQYYTITMAGTDEDVSYSGADCEASKITVLRKSKDTVVIKTNEINCYDEESDASFDGKSGIEITRNVNEEKFIGTYNELLSEIEEFDDEQGVDNYKDISSDKKEN